MNTKIAGGRAMSWISVWRWLILMLAMLFGGMTHAEVDSNGIISTVAGNGTSGFSGDGAAATVANINDPEGVAADSRGNLYIADTINQRIRKVDTAGIISTVAGNGTPGFSGDGTAATVASLSYPKSVAVDGSGNLYIADTENHRIRKVDTTGIISTVAGNGTPGFSGDGAAATMASLYYPHGVAVDGGGNIYIADSQNYCIRKVDTSGIISTVAGNGTPGFSGDGTAATGANLNYPYGVAVDGAGNLYIADTVNLRIRKVDTTGIISTVAGNGSYGFSGDGSAATLANMSYPHAVAVDSSGNLYFDDRNNQRIRKVDTTGIISTVAGNGTSGFSGDGAAAINASMALPRGVAFDGVGNLYIADAGNQRIRSVTPTYPFSGFFPPVANPPVVNANQAGAAIPVKFSLGGNLGLNIFAPGYPLAQTLSCTTSVVNNNVQTVTANASGLLYDSSNNQYVYVWKTDKAWSGTCQQLVLKLNDGTVHTALFSF